MIPISSYHLWNGFLMLVGVVLTALALLFLVFLVVKIGTYAYYKGREHWNNEQENKNG